MATTKTIGYGGETREITINGNAGAKFELYVKQGVNYYNWDTDAFQTLEKRLKNQEIPSNGKYVKNIIIPKVTSDTTYNLYMTTLPGTKSNVSLTHDQKIGTLYQKGGKTATFTATESSTLVVQNSGSAGSDLTGGTISERTSGSFQLQQEGTITEASSLFVYCHSVPSWDRATGGDWTLSNTIDSIVLWAQPDGKVMLTEGGGTNVASGDSVVGQGIIDEITVSAISGDLVTLSTPQSLKPGQQLTFSKSAWEIGPLSSKVANTSGTASILLKTRHEVSKVGIADITCVLDVDSHFSVKPNAFPVTGIECPAGGEVAINPIAQCTNYLGQLKDIDANVGTKTYKVHSIPTADTPTSRRPTGVLDANGDMTYVNLGFAGEVSVSAGAAMGSAGSSAVTYTAHASHIAGDEDYFYYKTTDAQSSAVTSSTTQGKISITIV